VSSWQRLGGGCEMSNLSFADKQYLEKALRMGEGYVLYFTDATFRIFFQSLDIDIDSKKYKELGISKANRLRTFFNIADNETVGRVLLELSNILRNEELSDSYHTSTTPIKFSADVKEIGQKLLIMPDFKPISQQSTSAIVTNNQITIEIRPEIYKHIKQYISTGDYFHAVEESYKVVRDKLRAITGQEQAHKAFDGTNYEKIFGCNPRTGAEKDFFEGVKFLNMALQNFRNEKAHSLAENLDKNLAIHYISLASLVYDLISGGK
jgi:uncharacterized protein (TIGR02391 family)